MRNLEALDNQEFFARKMGLMSIMGIDLDELRNLVDCAKSLRIYEFLSEQNGFWEGWEVPAEQQKDLDAGRAALERLK